MADPHGLEHISSILRRVVEHLDADEPEPATEAEVPVEAQP